MGLSFHVYTGPFFEPPSVDVVEENDRYVCGNGCTDTHYTTARFCQDCGQPITQIKIETEVQRLLTPDDLAGNWEDIIFLARRDEDDMRWLPNQHGFGFCNEVRDFGGVEVISSERIEREKSAFVQAHTDLIDAVRKQYGIDLTVSYGVVPYII